MPDTKQAPESRGNRNEPRRNYEEGGPVKEPTNRDKQNYQDPPHNQGHQFKPETQPETPPVAETENETDEWTPEHVMAK